MFTKSYLSDDEFHENQYSKSHTLLVGVNEFLSTLSTLVSNLSEIWYKGFVHNAPGQVCENQQREGSTLVMGVKNHSYMCIIKLYDILKVKNTSEKSVYYINL